MARFPCVTCGGKFGHVLGCATDNQERIDADARVREEFRLRLEERTRRVAGLVGKTLTSIESQAGYYVKLEFEGGEVFTIKLVGGELDGHFDPPSNRSLSFDVSKK